MISFLKGEVIKVSEKKATVLLASGLGYEVHHSISMNVGEEVSLFISHIIRENSQDLYSFKTAQEKELFEMLLSVKGVGPKSAYSLVCVLGVESLISAIQFEQKKVITQAPGIGAKAASQIFLDLKGKFSSMDFIQNFSSAELGRVVHKDSPSSSSGILSDALMACQELGFSEAKVLPVAKKILEESKISKAEELISKILKEI